MLRRRRREGGEHRQRAGHARAEGLSDAGSFDPDEAAVGRADPFDDDGAATAMGPWDVAEEYPGAERIDCGSLLIPARDGFDVQINVAEDQGAWVAVVSGDSGLQLQAFAAPRSDGLWDDVRQEIAVNIVETGGSAVEREGPFGAELHAQVPMAAEGQEPVLQPVRFLGVDGPRWFLRGVLSGPAATDGVLAEPFESLFGDVVVVRGDYPAPPREQLEIRLPEEARQALEAQFEQENPGWELPNPFVRGPEITETR